MCIRDRPTIGLLVHHAMYMALFSADVPEHIKKEKHEREREREREKGKERKLSSGTIGGSRGAALLCLPRLKTGVYTDWEAMSTPSADDFSEGTYWTLWDGDASHMMDCLRRQLADYHSTDDDDDVDEDKDAVGEEVEETFSGDVLGRDQEDEGGNVREHGSEL